MPPAAVAPSGSAASASNPPSCAELGSAPRCSPAGQATFTRAVNTGRYQSDLEFFAQKPRPAGSPHWQASQDRAAAVLTENGFEVARERYATGVNVLGIKRGTRCSDELVIVGAHYDGVPGCPAADDNASGAAGALEVARVLGKGRFARTLVVALWDEEELGFLGSEAHAAVLAERGAKVRAVFVYEMIGYRDPAPGAQRLPTGFELLFPEAIAPVRAAGFRGDFVFVASDELARDQARCFGEHAKAVGLPVAGVELGSALKRSVLLRDLQRSDHVSFWARDMPALLLTDSAEFRNRHYHCGAGPDVPSDLDPAFAGQLIQATVGAAADVLGPE